MTEIWQDGGITYRFMKQAAEARIDKSERTRRREYCDYIFKKIIADRKSH
jgi:hypothetical protein